MLENYLIKYCSPTLASLKSGSLFNCRCSQDAVLDESIKDWNSILSSRGIKIHLLRRTDTTALIYVYRQSSLKDILSDPKIRTFLQRYGYNACSCCDDCGFDQCSIETVLSILKQGSPEKVGPMKWDFLMKLVFFWDIRLQMLPVLSATREETASI